MTWLLIACSQRRDPTPADLDFYPVQKADYWVYQVTQTDYPLGAPPVMRRFQLQDKVSNVFERNGQPVYQLDRSVRSSPQGNWQIIGTQTVTQTAVEVITQEGNVPTVPLRFPVSTATIWNKNAYNSRPDSLLRYRDIGQPLILGNREFKQTISVNGTGDSTLVGLVRRRWVYAANVGLVLREEANLAYCQSSPACIGKTEIVSGTRQRWELLSSNRLP